MAHEGKRHPIAGSGNTSVAALLKKNQTNNESLFKAIASEKSHINQIGSATPDFNTVMKNYGTFSDKTWKRKVADEKARVTAFTSMPDDKSQTQLTDFDKNTKLKRKIEAENEIERVQNVKQDLLRQELSEVARGDDFSRVYDFKKQGQYQPKPVVEEKPSLVLDETTGIQTTASGQQLDAIGREINQLTTDVGQVSYSGKNTDDIAYAAQAAVVADVALTKSVKEAEKKLKIQQYDDLQAKQLADSLARTLELNKQAGIDESAFVRAGDVKSRITKIEEKKADEVKAAAAAADAAAAVARAAENLAWGVENLKQEKIKESALVRAGDVKSRIAKVEKEKEKAAKLAKKIALREFNATNAAADLKLQRIAREQEIAKAEAAFTRKKEDTRQNKLIEERANKSDKAAEDARKVSEQKANELRLLKSSNEDSLNSKTYGRDENKVLITPGNETLLIDTIADNAITGEGDTLGSLTAQIITERDTPKFLTPADIEARRSVNDGATPQKHFVEYQKQAQERLATKDYRTARERLLDKIKKDNADAEKAPVEKFKRVGEPGSLHGSDPFRFTTLQYPENVTTDKTNGHYILFYVNVQNKTKYKYDGYNDDGDYIQIGDVLETQHRSYQDSRGERFGNYIVSGTEESDFSSQPGPAISTDYTYSKGAEVGEIEYQKQQHSSGKPGNILQSNQVTLMKQRKASSGLASVLDLTSRITDSVALYLPANVENATSTGYQGFKTGMAGFLALSGLDVIDKIRNHDYEGAADGFMGMGGTIIYDMIRKAGISAFGAATRGEGVQENFDKAFGQTMNPFIDVAFDTMGLRSFEYTFDFRPKSATESTEVDAIIKLFRFHMVPELKGTNHRYMTLPSTFDIHYMYQTSPEEAEENPFYNKIATCVLEDCRVNYAPGETIQTFQSGAPTHITMTLKFMETEMLTKEKVNKGF